VRPLEKHIGELLSVEGNVHPSARGMDISNSILVEVQYLQVFEHSNGLLTCIVSFLEVRRESGRSLPGVGERLCVVLQL